MDNNFYEIVKLFRGGLSLDLPAYDGSLNNKSVFIAWDSKKTIVPKVYALGIFTDPTLERMYKEGYFKVEPADAFEKEVASIFAPVEDKKPVIEDKKILEYLTKGNRVEIKKLIAEENEVITANLISIARENIDSISTSMIRDLEKYLQISIVIEDDTGAANE